MERWIRTVVFAALVCMGLPAGAANAACVGDCDDNGTVTIDEILTMEDIALGSVEIAACEAGDADHNGQIAIDEILAAVNNALNGCGTSVPTPTPAPHIVMVGPNGTFTFNPQNLTINTGDTVEWIWASGGHTVVSGSTCTADNQFCSPNDASCASTPTSLQSATYSHTFSTPGTYPYFCSVHCFFNMVGTITVQ